MTHLKSNYVVPGAIIIAGVLVASAIFYSSGVASVGLDTLSPSANFRTPGIGDHVRGNPDAKISIVEFSDFECPFCAQLHPTLQRIVTENTDVQWVYRHFPLSTIHSNAERAAVASECIAKLAGNDAFWKFADGVFARQRELGDELYESFAASTGIDIANFKACLDDAAVATEVSTDRDEAIRAGGQGTPFVVVVSASGMLAPFSGALPYTEVQRLVDQALVK